VADVVHGKLSPDGDPATLLVFKFVFEQAKNGRRFREAHIKITFLDPDTHIGHLAPEVHGIAPEGTLYLAESRETIEVTRTGSIGINGVVAPATVSIGVKYTTTKERDGSIKVAGVRWEERSEQSQRLQPNAVIWDLLENSQTDSGLPSLVQSAIRLKHRKTENGGPEDLRAKVEVKLHCDWLTHLEPIVLTAKEPVVFNANQVPNGDYWMTENLGKIDLQKIVSFAPVPGTGNPVDGSKIVVSGTAR
jgi:hypothetical protein